MATTLTETPRRMCLVQLLSDGATRLTTTETDGSVSVVNQPAIVHASALAQSLKTDYPEAWEMVLHNLTDGELASDHLLQTALRYLDTFVQIANASMNRGGVPSDRTVYFMLSSSTGLVKIGSSGDPDRRLRDLQMASGERISLLTTEPGGEAHEKALHRRFKASRVRGEWFRHSEAIRTHIANAEAAHRLPRRKRAPVSGGKA